MTSIAAEMANFEQAWRAILVGNRRRELLANEIEDWTERKVFGIAREGARWSVQVAWMDNDGSEWPLSMSTKQNAKDYLGTKWEGEIKR